MQRGVIAAASGEFEVGRRGFAAPIAIFVADLLTFIQATKTSRLHCCDVNKHVLAAVLRHDEAEALGRVEPTWTRIDSHYLRHSSVRRIVQQRAMLVDNRPFGRLEGTRSDGGAASQAKMRLRCAVGTERPYAVNHSCATLTRLCGSLAGSEKLSQNPRTADQNPLRVPRDVMARANSPPAAMARRPAASSAK